MTKPDQYELHEIGTVQAGAEGFAIAIHDPFRSALLELDGFSHINVIWWANLVDDDFFRELTIAEKPYRDAPNEIGIFATRSPARPNPLALTTVPVVSIDHSAGLIRVAYIDAEDGSPVVDLKPYLPATDRVRDVAFPDWAAGWPQWYEDSATFDWSAVFENAQ